MALAIMAFGVLLVAVVLLALEVRKLRAGIRAHRDARGNDRCFLDDELLYRLVPDHEAVTVLPERDVFLGNCARFWANRQHPYHLALFKSEHPGGATPPRCVFDRDG